MVLALVTFPILCRGQQPIIWNGPTFTFTEPGPVGSDPANQDRLNSSVWLTRNSNLGLYNAEQESGYTVTSPVGTEWAFGNLTNYASLSYLPWHALGKPPALLGQPTVVHLINDNIYISLTLTAWGERSAGGFAYQRSSPGVAVPGPPVVSITSPTNGAVFVAPARVQLTASATETGGSVTNVEFLLGSKLLGSVDQPPFNMVVTGLTAGNYSFFALATDGLNKSTLSSAVKVTVTAPTIQILLPSVTVASGMLQFGFTTMPGQSYFIETSGDLLAWNSITNPMATNSTTLFTDSAPALSAVQYYRVRLGP